MKLILPLLALLLSCTTSIGQEKKTLEAKRISTPPKIDGVLDDPVWKSLQAYGDFNMYQPGNEGEIPQGFETEVKMAYDNKNVYVAAYMYDPDPDAILSQFSQRDEIFVQADHFAVALNTLNDGINETHFFVTSAGTIGDALSTQNNFDFSYNVVFECRISKDDKGWYAEYRIPYNALRFPEIEVQDWGVNFYRKLTTQNETHTWNFIDITKGRESQYSGNVIGVRDINPPVRLTFFPFAQGVVSSFDGETEVTASAGMDIKYGLSDSFTLDATLIPDFGQASFDEVRLNLGPFEQTFSENRQFFVEGVDLFRKAETFFSRRVGGPPVGEVGDLGDNEEAEVPDKVNLLNAIKISGRTKGKLGVGFFNAITEKTFAKVTDTINGNSRKVLVEPLANYNIVVLDQQFNGNSSVSFVNTNVTRDGSFRDANTTAAVFDIADRGNRFRGAGRAVISNVITEEGVKTGFRSEFDFFRIKGQFRYRFSHDLANTTFDINDLGVNFRNNFNSFGAGISYQIFEPTKVFNEYNIGLSFRHRRLYQPSVQTRNSLDFNWFFFTTKRLAFGGFVGYNSENDDYFEPRVEGRFVTYEPNVGGRVFTSTDFRKKFAVDIGVGYRKHLEGGPQRQFFLDFEPRYRFSDSFLVVLSTDVSLRNNMFGYIEDNEADIFFGQRDITSIENQISAGYNFDPYKAIDLSFRNFWSVADYSDDIFWTLNEDGSRTRVDANRLENDPNRNFNIWNLDLSFRWRFAPGSEAILLYRNQIFKQDEQATLNYTESLNNLFNEPTQHTLSLRVTYFIDYNNIKDFFRKNEG